MKKIASILFLFSASFSLFGQDITGQWNGVLKLQGAQLRVIFNISKSDTNYVSTMDSPDQGAKGIPVTTTSFDKSILRLTVKNLGLEYVGRLAEDGTITGNLKQAGQSFPVTLSRGGVKKEETVTPSRIDNEFFAETPVVLETGTGKIFGTFTIPKGAANSPLVLIIAGSGPTDRDCNNSMMKCDAYKQLAHTLAKNKIASLRYDKRGIAESSQAGKNESDLRFDDYVNDAKEWIQLIKKDSRFSKVIVLGHSEGSLIGMIASGNAGKFISVAGAGRSADKILKEQLTNQPKDFQDLSFPIIDSLKKGKTVRNVDPSLNALFRPSVQPYMISWFKYDPQKEIRKVKIPILIIQGTNDIQVTVGDAKVLSKANPKSQLLLIDKMNHVFRTTEGDRQANIATYNDPALPLNEEFVNAVMNFVLKH